MGGLTLRTAIVTICVLAHHVRPTRGDGGGGGDGLLLEESDSDVEYDDPEPPTTVRNQQRQKDGAAAPQSADGLQELAQSQAGAPAEPLECHIDRVGRISPAEFHSQYRSKGRPVIVQTDVSGVGIGGPEDLLRSHGHVTITALKSDTKQSQGKQRMTLGAFLAKDVGGGWREGLDYVLDVDLARSAERASFADLFSPPSFVVDEDFTALGGMLSPWEYLLVGPPGSGSPDHWHGKAFNLLVCVHPTRHSAVFLGGLSGKGRGVAGPD